MSWGFYLGSILFFTLLFGVFLAVAWSVLLQVRENYYRYYQKADLQWTGAESRFPRARIKLRRLLLLAFLCAWFIVHFWIAP